MLKSLTICASLLFFLSSLGCASPQAKTLSASPHQTTLHGASAVADEVPDKVAGKVPDAEKTSLFSPESPYQRIDDIEPEQIIHLRTGLKVSQADFMAHLAPARIIYVGEAHDSLEDHRVQLEVIKGLFERFPGKIAVGMEMFRSPSQPLLDDWIAGKLDQKAFIKRWYEDWGSDIAYYKDLLDFIKENSIPLIALKPSQEMEVKVRMKGFDKLSENDQRRLPEIDRNDPYHREALEAVFKGHGPASNRFKGFNEMMLLWDETMADRTVNYLNSPEGADKKMVILAGGFHVAYGYGIPRRVFRRLPVPYQVVMPYSKDFPEEMKMKNVVAPNLPLPLADFVWGVGYQPLKQKKVRLGVQIEPFQAGIRIMRVFPNTAAEAAGLEDGDIVVSFDGKTMNEPFDLTYAVQEKKPGDKVEIVVIRAGKQITLTAELKTSKHQ